MPDFYIVTEMDPERLTATTQDEAIEAYLDSAEYAHAELNNKLPEVIQIQAYKKMVLSEDNGLFAFAFEQLNESIDEEFNPQGELKQDAEIAAAYQAFVKLYVEKYNVWSCEPYGETVSVNLRERIEKRDIADTILQSTILP